MTKFGVNCDGWGFVILRGTVFMSELLWIVLQRDAEGFWFGIGEHCVWRIEMGPASFVVERCDHAVY